MGLVFAGCSFLVDSLADEQHFSASQNLTSLTFWFALYILFTMQNDDELVSSSPADRFA
jgi:hypothetical protein